MKKLRIGYFPLSKDLTHPGDRRRLVYWAQTRGHELVLNPDQNIDFIVASETTDLYQLLRSHKGIPIVYDLIDAYLTPDSQLRNYGRGFAKFINRSVTGRPKRYTETVQDYCKIASATICSSQEQSASIKRYSKNVHIILDSHDEIPLSSYRGQNHSSSKNIMWEGMPYTLPGLFEVRAPLYSLAKEFKMSLDIVTDLDFKKYLGKYVSQSTDDLIRNVYSDSPFTVNLIPWEINALVSKARSSHLGIIPVKENAFQWLKPENRLLIMWRLGLPCITSATPSFSRVSEATRSDFVCNSQTEWVFKISRVLEDPLYAEHNVLLGQKYLRENHSKEIFLSNWDNVVKSVI
jgi:hypothetical protein